MFTPHCRLEAHIEGSAVVVSLYGNFFELSAEITPAAARQLAAGLTEAANISEAIGHVED